MPKYIVPRTNVGKGGFVSFNGIRYHTPSWTVVEEDTTLDDIEFERELFAELFDKPKEEQWEFISARSGDKYTVRYNVRKELSCSCWGYISHKKCKHIKEVKESL